MLQLKNSIVVIIGMTTAIINIAIVFAIIISKKCCLGVHLPPELFQGHRTTPCEGSGGRGELQSSDGTKHKST